LWNESKEVGIESCECDKDEWTDCKAVTVHKEIKLGGSDTDW